MASTQRILKEELWRVFIIRQLRLLNLKFIVDYEVGFTQIDELTWFFENCSSNEVVNNLSETAIF